MISREFIGKRLPRCAIEVEKYPLRYFATTIGANSPIHHDENAAVAAGYRSLVAPPTYVSCLQTMANPDPYEFLEMLEVDLKQVLHGEQYFKFYHSVCAGDRLFFDQQIVDIYDKKGGALEFVVTDTTVTNSENNKVAEMRSVMIVRNQP